MEDATEVTVILPNVTPADAAAGVEAVEAVPPESVRVLGYPKYLIEHEALLERKFISNRELTLSVTVDALTGGRFRNDTYPDLEARTIPFSGLLEPRINRETAVEKARSVMRRYISFHFSTFVMVSNLPPMDVTREDLVFNLYWLVPTGESAAGVPEVTIVDSVTQDIVEREVTLAEVSEERMASATGN